MTGVDTLQEGTPSQLAWTPAASSAFCGLPATNGPACSPVVDGPASVKTVTELKWTWGSADPLAAGEWVFVGVPGLTTVEPRRSAENIRAQSS